MTADIFLSYSRKDLARASHLARALAQVGWSVFWDQRIPAGASWDEHVEKAIDDSRCVIVLWSANSVTSRWVKTEARLAVERGVLVPASLDDSKAPLEFRYLETAQLQSWAGDLEDAEFSVLTEGISRHVRRQYSRQCGEIAFRYSDSPENHGWSLHCDLGSERHFECVSQRLPRFASALKITAGLGNRLDYGIGSDGERIGGVELFVRPAEGFRFYVRCNVTHQGNWHEPVWLRFDTGPTFEPTHDEAHFPLSAVVRTDGWTDHFIALPSKVEQAFGSRGLSFAALDRIGIRGSGVIGQIVFYES